MVGLLTAVTSARVGAVVSVAVVVLSVVVVVSPADESAATASSFEASSGGVQAAKRNRNSRMDSGKRAERFSFLTLPGSKKDDGSIVPLIRFMTQVFTWTYLKLTFAGYST